MHHSHEAAVGGGHHVYHVVGLRQRLLQHDHRETGGACRHVARALLDGIGGGHTRSGIAFGRAYGDAGFQVAGDVETLGALGGEETGMLTGHEYAGQDVLQGEGQPL